MKTLLGLAAEMRSDLGDASTNVIPRGNREAGKVTSKSP
jgi:hypothetical protein